MSVISKAFGMNVKKYRAQFGMTQNVLAKITGVTRYSILNYETGIIPLSSNLLKLANTFGVTPDELLDGSGYTYDSLYHGGEIANPEQYHLNGVGRIKCRIVAEISDLSEEELLRVTHFICAIKKERKVK